MFGLRVWWMATKTCNFPTLKKREMKISESKNILLIKLCLLVAQNQTSMKTFSVFIFTLITTYVHNVQLDLQEFILQIFFWIERRTTIAKLEEEWIFVLIFYSFCNRKNIKNKTKNELEGFFHSPSICWIELFLSVLLNETVTVGDAFSSAVSPRNCSESHYKKYTN